MRYGPIPEYGIDIADDQEGLPMVRTVVDGRAVWVELHDPCLDGTTISRDEHGGLVAALRVPA